MFPQFCSNWPCRSCGDLHWKILNFSWPNRSLSNWIMRSFKNISLNRPGCPFCISNHAWKCSSVIGRSRMYGKAKLTLKSIRRYIVIVFIKIKVNLTVAVCGRTESDREDDFSRLVAWGRSRTAPLPYEWIVNAHSVVEPKIISHKMESNH